MKKTEEKKNAKKLVRVLSFRLFIGVFSAFILTVLFTIIIKYTNAVYTAHETLEEEVLEARAELISDIQTTLYDSFDSIHREYYQSGPDAFFKSVPEYPEYTYITDRSGTIKASLHKEDEGKSITDIEQLSIILDDINRFYEEYSKEIADCGITGQEQCTTRLVPTLDKKENVYYVVMYYYERPDDYFFYPVSEGHWNDIQTNQAKDLVDSKTIGEDGFLVITDTHGIILDSYHSFLMPGLFPNMDIINRFETGDKIVTKTVNDSDLLYFKEPLNNDIRVTNGEESIEGQDSFFYAVDLGNGIYAIGISPITQAINSMMRVLLFYILEDTFVFIVLFFLLQALIRRIVINRLDSVNQSLREITDGNLEKKVEVTGTEEFEKLSSDINHMVDRLKGYIEEEKARIGIELAMAEEIQNSALPNLFPPYPEHDEFELFASMNAAKEVGGDFYDYHLIDDNKLVFLIADVSGKSIGGAMFMMLSKTVISDLVEQRLTPGAVFTRANNKLLQNNDEGMFVTAWLGYLDIETGIVRFTNAGHKPAILIRNGKAMNLISKTNLMLSAIPDTEYEEEEIQLQPGDLLYLYTDGVTEAEDPGQNQFGTKQLMHVLSFGKTPPEPGSKGGLPQTMCEQVYKNVKDFMGDAEQFDDITMLCIRYFGK